MAAAKSNPPAIGPSLDTKVDCLKCNDAGVIQIDERTVRLCECREQVRIERLFRSSRITAAFRQKTFENFDPNGRSEVVQTMYRGARSYADGFDEIRATENNWLAMLGQPGSGKTHLAMAAANMFLNRSIPVLYIPHNETMNEFKDLLRTKDGIKDRTEEMKKVEVLAWDDLFKNWNLNRTFEIDIAFEVLNYRYLNLLPTIITSEKGPDRLLGIDEAIGSRIIERSRGRLIVVQGQENNYRLE
jgi:DNA replication protein DnaC